MFSLHHDQDIVFQILTRDIPWLVAGIATAADAESLALADRVVHQPTVFADGLAFRCLHQSRVCRQVSGQEFPERAFTNETDASAVFLVEHR